MDIATIVVMAIGLILVAFAVVAVISSIRGVSHITLEEPAEGSPKRGAVESFQEKLAVLNRTPVKQ